MYRLLHIKLKNFRGKNSLNLNLADENVSIIHGTNGTGKTTLLKVIHGVLKMNEAVLADENIPYALFIFVERLTGYKKFLCAELVKEKDIYEWSTDIDDLDSFVESFSSLVFGVNRGITYNSNINRIAPIDVNRTLREFDLTISENSPHNGKSFRVIEEITDYLNIQVINRSKRIKRNRIDINLHENHLMLDHLSMNHVENLLNEKYLIEKKYMSERVQNALFETLAQVLDNQDKSNKKKESIPEDFLIKLSIYQDTLLELLSELEGNKFSKKIINILSNYETSINNPFKGKELISNLVYNMITELEKGKGVINTVTQLVDEFNNYLEKGKKLIVDEKGARIKAYKDHHGIEKLSSGEKHLLSLLTLFIIEGSTRDILMIDEPEISLNLEWQSKLLPMLTKFAPNSQIIVATHSPSIAEFNTNNLVEIR